MLCEKTIYKIKAINFLKKMLSYIGNYLIKTMKVAIYLSNPADLKMEIKIINIVWKTIYK